MDLLNKLSRLNQKRRATIVMVTHDPVAASYSGRVVFIKDGRVYTRVYTRPSLMKTTRPE